jgi:hypothetical protein
MAISISAIPKTKHSPQQLNYNSGKVFVKCFINRSCPTLFAPKQNYGLVFNSNTLQSFPDEWSKIFQAVPGLPGMYLKEKHNYRSNLLAVYGSTGNFLNYAWDIQTVFGENQGYPSYAMDQTWIVDRSVFDYPNVFIPSPSDYDLNINNWDPNVGFGMCSARWYMRGKADVTLIQIQQ